MIDQQHVSTLDDLLADLLGFHEVVELIGVNDSTFWRWCKYPERYPLPVPAPILRLACGPIWYRPEIEAWNAQRIALGLDTAPPDRAA